jgi:hypothetical protein
MFKIIGKLSKSEIVWIIAILLYLIGVIYLTYGLSKEQNILKFEINKEVEI